MTRYKITIEYDGKNYNGWQAQKGLNTIQGALEESVQLFCGEKVSIYGAGRTDTGVHASGQVAHLDLDIESIEDKKNKLGKLTMGINYYLSRNFNNEITIISSKKVNQEFHARFSAKYRRYKYTILNKRTGSPLNRNNSWRVPLPLNLQSMIKASKLLIGKHDFSSFRSTECQSNSPIKTIDDISITKNKDFIFIKVTAKSFLMNQVRIITGTLVEVGLNRKTEEDIKLALKKYNKKHVGPTAPAHGLVLEKISY